MMKQLNKTQSALFLIGGVLMVIGAGCFAFLYEQQVVCWIYLVGALLFATICGTRHDPRFVRLIR